jgi:hypothetical protein
VFVLVHEKLLDGQWSYFGSGQPVVEIYEDQKVVEEIKIEQMYVRRGTRSEFVVEK